MPYLVALALTLTIEIPLYVVLGPLQGRRIESTEFGAAAVLNLVSHPLFWFVAYPLATAAAGDTAGLLLSEALVVVGEAAGLRILLGQPWIDALARSTLANAASLLAGLALNETVF